MVTGRERSHLSALIFSHNSFNGFKSPKREATFLYRAAAISLLPTQLIGKVYTQRDFSMQKPKQLTPPHKSCHKKQPSVRRLQHPSPPSGQDALLRLPSVHGHHYCCQNQCHPLDTHIPRKACFSQVWNGGQGGLSRLS